jgi:nucleoside-diphosphate-sugar epimerase
MNILFSGVTGYLGSNVASHMAELGHNIHLLDRDYLIDSQASSFESFFYFSNPNELNFRESVDQSITDFVAHFLMIRRALEKLEVRQIVYASSVRASDSVPSPYGAAHMFVERLLECYCQERNIKLSILRFGNIFGGSMSSMVKRNTLVPHCFIREALALGTITVTSDGKQTRDFTPISHCYKYIELALTSGSQTFYVCTGTQMSILEVVTVVKDVFPATKAQFSTKTVNSSGCSAISLVPLISLSRLRIISAIWDVCLKWRGADECYFK